MSSKLYGLVRWKEMDHDFCQHLFDQAHNYELKLNSEKNRALVSVRAPGVPSNFKLRSPAQMKLDFVTSTIYLLEPEEFMIDEDLYQVTFFSVEHLPCFDEHKKNRKWRSTGDLFQFIRDTGLPQEQAQTIL